MNTDYKETGQEDNGTVSDVKIADKNGIRNRLCRDGNQAQSTASDGSSENSEITEEVRRHQVENTNNTALNPRGPLPKHESSWGLWIMGSINIVFILVLFSLVQDIKSIRSEIDSLRDNGVVRHAEQEAELNNKILKLEANFEKKYNLLKSVNVPYEEMEAQLKDLNWIQNMIETTSASFNSDSKELWLSEYKNAKNMFDKNGNIKPLKSQKNELDAIMDKSELFTFAMALKNEKKYHEAFGLYEKIYKRSRANLGIDHQNTLVVQQMAAICLTGLEDHNKALELERYIYERRSETLNPTHVDTLSAQHNIAVSLHRLGKNAEALHLYKEVYSQQAKTLGLDNEKTLLTKQNMEKLKDRI